MLHQRPAELRPVGIRRWRESWLHVCRARPLFPYPRGEGVGSVDVVEEGRRQVRNAHLGALRLF